MGDGKKVKKEKKDKKIKKEKKTKIKKDKSMKKGKKFLEIIKNKWLIKGTTTLLLVAIVIACYILINWGVSKLQIENIDCTEKKLYSLSDETKSKMKNLEKDITIQLINTGESSYITEYANKYPTVSKKITVEEISDLSSRVDLQTKYSITESGSLIVVKSGEKEKTLTSSDLYTYDYSTGKQINKIEEALTNAIIEVTLDEKPHVYILSGKTYYDTENVLSIILSELKDESNEVDYLDLLTQGEIPADCDCLIITTLKQDLSELERDKILEYINNGGKILMLTSQNMLDVETPNLKQVLSQYGVSMEYGAVLEQDSSKMLQNAPNTIVEDASASFMDKLDMKIKMCAINAGKIKFDDDDKLSELGVTYETIVQTSDKAFVRTNFNTKSSSRTDNDGEEESIIIGAYVKKTVSDEKTSQLIIYSNELFASNLEVTLGTQYFTYASELYNNRDVVLNSISHLTERDDTISIRKASESETYTVTDQEDVIIKTIIFTVPFIIIMIGIVVWIYRRRKA